MKTTVFRAFEYFLIAIQRKTFYYTILIARIIVISRGYLLADHSRFIFIGRFCFMRGILSKILTNGVEKKVKVRSLSFGDPIESLFPCALWFGMR